MRKWLMRALLALSAASMALAVAPAASAANDDKIVICHATSSTSNPYVKIVVDPNSAKAQGHLDHSDDIFDPPSGECPAGEGNPGNGNGDPGNGGGGNSDRVTICHATGSSTNPYQEIQVPANTGHNNHEDDIIPAPPGGCPDPGYNPDDIDLRAQSAGAGQVEFSLRGCPKGGSVDVTIGGVTVAGSPFTVPNNDTLQQTVAIPAGANGNVLQITCDEPVIVWEVVIDETPAVETGLTAAKEAKTTSFANPADDERPGRKSQSSSPSVPARQIGFGVGSLAGLLAFGGLRRGSLKFPRLD